MDNQDYDRYEDDCLREERAYLDRLDEHIVNPIGFPHTEIYDRKQISNIKRQQQINRERDNEIRNISR